MTPTKRHHGNDAAAGRKLPRTDSPIRIHTQNLQGLPQGSNISPMMYAGMARFMSSRDTPFLTQPLELGSQIVDLCIPDWQDHHHPFRVVLPWNQQPVAHPWHVDMLHMGQAPPRGTLVATMGGAFVRITGKNEKYFHKFFDQLQELPRGYTPPEIPARLRSEPYVPQDLLVRAHVRSHTYTQAFPDDIDVFAIQETS